MALNSDKSGFGLDMESRLKGKSTGNNTDTHTHTVTDTDTDTYAVKENQTKRTYGTTWPSVHSKIVKYAKAHDTSYNDIVNTLLLEFIEKHNL